MRALMNLYITLSRTKWEAKERECQTFFQLLRNKNRSSNIFSNIISVVGIREGVKSRWRTPLPVPTPLHWFSGEGSSGSWARKSGNLYLESQIPSYTGSYVGCRVVGRRRRGDEEFQLFWAGVKSCSCAAPGEECLSSDLRQMVSYAVLCLHGEIVKKCL